MGLEYFTSRLLLQARSKGFNFGRVLTVGRQNFVVTKRHLRKLASEFHFDADAFIRDHRAPDLVYVEPFFRALLKCKSIESIDVSAYEGASHVHDMNDPLPAALKEQFDTVLECGSLEHIFNFPTAIKNLMEAVKAGGMIFLQTPANNYFGHGFYQFSPELFFRIFSAENGFEIKRIQIFEHFYPYHFFDTAVYDISDPARLRRRVQLVNNRPTLLLIEAKRVSVKPVFASTPQQSDYVPLWEQIPAKTPASTQTPQPICSTDNWKHKLYGIPLRWVGHLFLQYLGRKSERPALDNSESFRRMD